MQWISVKDSLPKLNEPCLLYKNYDTVTYFGLKNKIMIGQRKHSDHFVSVEFKYSDVPIEFVSHWMPLPKPPEE
jgi:hypothetical protein